MRFQAIAIAATTLLLASAARADGPNTGRNWDDSHMRSRHVSAAPPQTRPTILMGEVASEKRLAEQVLPEATWHSWTRGGKSVTFGEPPARQRSRSSSNITSSRRGGTGGTSSLGSTTRGLR